LPSFLWGGIDVSAGYDFDLVCIRRGQQAVLRLGCGRDYFLPTVFNYPTLGYEVAAHDASNELRF
jgi:hypothetical protein